MLQRVCSVVDHSWRQSVVRTKKWQSEPCGLNVTISASCDWSVAIFITSLESQESYLTLRNLTLQITQDFFRLHNTFARLYNAAASPASRLRSAGSLAITKIFKSHLSKPSKKIVSRSTLGVNQISVAISSRKNVLEACKQVFRLYVMQSKISDSKCW